jgi:type I restriction enzyme S subunit
MKYTIEKLGPNIREVSIKNNDLAVTRLLGVSIQKEFISSRANIIGTDLSNYKVVRKGQFAYGPVTSRNGDKISIALLDSDECIVSTSYTAFEVIDESKIFPQFLMLWFARAEFDRYARFMSHGSVREIFGWEEMCEVELPLPSLEAQRAIALGESFIRKHDQHIGEYRV